MDAKILYTETLAHYKKHNAVRMGAALSYYAIFAIAPIIIILIALVGAFIGSNTVEQNVLQNIQSILGETIAVFIRDILTNLQRENVSTVNTIISTIVLFVASLGLFFELNKSLNDLWRLPKESSEQSGTFFERVTSSIKQRLSSYIVVPLLGVVLFLSVVLTFFSSHTTGSFFYIISLGISFTLSILFFALLYKILPKTTCSWKEAWIGATVTALLFLIGRVLIMLYLETIAHPTMYGAANSLVALLIWIYYSAQVFFIGASFTFVYSKTYGSLKPYFSASQNIL